MAPKPTSDVLEKGRPKNIDLVLKGLAYQPKNRDGTPRVDKVTLKSLPPTDRFNVTSETRDPDQYKLRVAMVRDLKSRLLWDVLHARMDGVCTTAELWDAYRQGDTALKALVGRVSAEAKNPPLPPLAERFIREELKGLASADATARQVRRFVRYLGDDARVQDVTAGNILAFLDGLKKLDRKDKTGLSETDKPSSAASKNRHRAAVYGLCSFMFAHGLLPRHPLQPLTPREREKLRRPVERRPFPKVTPAAYQAYFTALAKAMPDAVTFFRCLCHTGLDFSELLAREVRHFHLDGTFPHVTSRRTKLGDRADDRDVPIPHGLVPALRAAVDGKAATDPVFTFNIWALRRAHDVARREAGKTHPMVREWTIKSHRHLAAIFFKWEGVPLDDVADYLGHLDLSMTKRYRKTKASDDMRRLKIEDAFEFVNAPQSVVAEPASSVA